MKKIFLSLGFSGRPEEIIRKEIEGAKELIKSYYHDEKLEFIHNYDYTGDNSVECLGEAIKKISECDKVYFINNWYDYNGCIIEKKVCEIYYIPNATISLISNIIF